jgi:hypothetical protein
MNRDEILKMAQEAGAFWELSETPEKDVAFLMRFAERVAAYEREYKPKVTQRQPLTEDQIDDIWNRYCDEMGEASINDAYDIARAIEAAHGIGEKK